MDQDPKMAGGTNTDNRGQGEPSQNIPTSNHASATYNNMSSANPQGSQNTSVEADLPRQRIVRPVDSHHIEHDLRLPGDKENRRTKAIIGIVIGVFILILGCLAVWFFAFYNNPEKVMFDGIQNVLHAKNIALDGGSSILLREADSSDSVESAILNLTSSSSTLPNTTEANLLVTFADDRSLNLQLGSVILTDGVIYLKASGIMESLDGLGLTTKLQTEYEDRYNTLELANDEWWRISVRDAITELTDNPVKSDYFGQIYDCALNAATSDYHNTLAKLYQQHPFTQVSAINQLATSDGYTNYQSQPWHNLYEIRLDKAALADFINALPETEIAENFYACYNDAVEQYNPAAEELSVQDFAELSADEIAIPDELHLYAEISQFGHQIRSLWAYLDNEQYSNTTSVKLKYQDAVVSAPEEYRDATELIQQLPERDVLMSIGEATCSLPGLPGIECDCAVLNYGQWFFAPIYEFNSEEAI